MKPETPRCPICNDDDSVLLSGRRASQGCVVGPVALLMDPSMSAAVPDGSILVIPMTDPDCVPAMKRAAAIVTDRGGAMCHAALVARELQKPCVVGTKSATTTCNEGQLVRVCANRGLILAI